MILTFQDSEENILKRVLSILEDDRSHMTAAVDIEPVLSFGSLTILQYQHRVLREGKEIPVVHLEFQVLLYLAEHPGRVFSKAQIYEAVWKEEIDDYDNAVSCVIYKLRKKLEANPANPSYIRTVRGIGYKFTNPHQ